MNRSQLQLVHIKQTEEKPQFWSFLKRLRDSLNTYINESGNILTNNGEENYLTKFDYVECKPESQIIAGFIIENMYNGIKVLEIGCGNGSLYQHLNKLPVQYSGIDISAKDIETARDKYNKSGRPVFLNRDFFEFSAAGCFDVVVINNFIESFKSSKVKFLLEKASSLLKDESSVIIVSLPRQLKAWKVWRKLKRFPSPYLDISVTNNTTGIIIDIKAYRGITH
ncbi:MAG: class I SAM-dependent methyltransferase [Ignavibacteriae bacterium]|nr:MAG: class I SAM-dependent methyltransferase [Ignavibacteriota bacterium]